MRLGQRSTRGRSGHGGQLIPPLVSVGVATITLLATPVSARTMSVGPARIVCNASFCEMGPSTRPKERVRVIISELPHEETMRLRKCTGVSKPCIVSIEGAEQGSPSRVMATAVQWQE